MKEKHNYQIPFKLYRWFRIIERIYFKRTKRYRHSYDLFPLPVTCLLVLMTLPLTIIALVLSSTLSKVIDYFSDKHNNNRELNERDLMKIDKICTKLINYFKKNSFHGISNYCKDLTDKERELIWNNLDINCYDVIVNYIFSTDRERATEMILFLCDSKKVEEHLENCGRTKPRLFMDKEGDETDVSYLFRECGEEQKGNKYLLAQKKFFATNNHLLYNPFHNNYVSFSYMKSRWRKVPQQVNHCFRCGGVIYDTDRTCPACFKTICSHCGACFCDLRRNRRSYY